MLKEAKLRAIPILLPLRSTTLALLCLGIPELFLIAFDGSSAGVAETSWTNDGQACGSDRVSHTKLNGWNRHHG